MDDPSDHGCAISVLSYLLIGLPLSMWLDGRGITAGTWGVLLWIPVVFILTYFVAYWLEHRKGQSSARPGRSGRVEYYTYLRSSEWKATRNAALARAGHRCQLCGSRSGPFEVHHNSYANLGNERPEDLIVLCRACHARFHAGGRMPV